MKKMILILVLIISFLLSGCTPKEVNTINNAVKAKQESKVNIKPVNKDLIPSFEISQFNTPFIFFIFPKNWDNSDDIQNYSSYSSIIRIIRSNNNSGVITIKEKFDNSINSADQARIQFIKECDSIQSIGYLDKTSYINKNIAIVEGIVYGKYTIRAKEYFWNNGKGKTYQVEIACENNDWNELTEIIKVFEQSLKFKI